MWIDFTEDPVLCEQIPPKFHLCVDRFQWRFSSMWMKPPLNSTSMWMKKSLNFHFCVKEDVAEARHHWSSTSMWIDTSLNFHFYVNKFHWSSATVWIDFTEQVRVRRLWKSDVTNGGWLTILRLTSPTRVGGQWYAVCADVWIQINLIFLTRKFHFSYIHSSKRWILYLHEYDFDPWSSATNSRFQNIRGDPVRWATSPPVIRLITINHRAPSSRYGGPSQ